MTFCLKILTNLKYTLLFTLENIYLACPITKYFYFFYTNKNIKNTYTVQPICSFQTMPELVIV